MKTFGAAKHQMVFSK